MRKLVKFLNTILICVSILTCSIPVEAAADLNLIRLTDMSLTKSGIFASPAVIESIISPLRNIVNGSAQSYHTWLFANGYDLPDISMDTFREYLNSDAAAGAGFVLPTFILQSELFIDVISSALVNGSDITDREICQLILNETSINSGESYQIPGSFTNYVTDQFNTYESNTDLGYHYVRVRDGSTFPPEWLKDLTGWNNIVSYFYSSNIPTPVAAVTKGVYQCFVFPNFNEYYVVLENNVVKFYDTEWLPLNYDSHFIELYYDTTSVKDKDTFLQYTNQNGLTTCPTITTVADHVYDVNTCRLYFWGSSEGKTIIYDSLADLKNNTAGNKTYYRNTNTVYNSSADNSVSFTGDYYNGNANSYSYNVMKEQITNNNASTDNSVTNIVNNYSQTIINNYTGSGEGSGGSSGGTGSIGDGIQSFFDGLLALLDFILELLGKVVEAVSTLLSGVLSLLTSLTDSFSGFTGLLGGMFSFLPQEVMDILSLGITAIVTIGIIKAIKG